MIRTNLDASTRDRLRALRRADLPPKVRDRIEMVTLSDAGWSAPRIAAHLGYRGQTVRDILRNSLALGVDALYPRRTGPAPDAGRHERVAEELRRSPAEDRTWTSRQLAEALATRGIAPGPHMQQLKESRLTSKRP